MFNVQLSKNEACQKVRELGSHLERWVASSTELGTPLAVTVARSSLDDFCPPEQVEFIQEQTLDVISSTIENVAVHLLYKQENAL